MGPSGELERATGRVKQDVEVRQCRPRSHPHAGGWMGGYMRLLTNEEVLGRNSGG